MVDVIWITAVEWIVDCFVIGVVIVGGVFSVCGFEVVVTMTFGVAVVVFDGVVTVFAAVGTLVGALVVGGFVGIGVGSMTSLKIVLKSNGSKIVWNRESWLCFLLTYFREHSIK